MATLYSKTSNGLVPINRGYNVIIEDSLNSTHTDRALSAKQGKVLKDAIEAEHAVNEFTIAIASWAASTASADYPYEALVTTDKYSATFIPTYIDMIPADGSAFFSEAETDAKGLLNQQIVFGASGFTAYASDVPTCPIKLRICGEV